MRKRKEPPPAARSAPCPKAKSEGPWAAAARGPGSSAARCGGCPGGSHRDCLRPGRRGEGEGGGSVLCGFLFFVGGERGREGEGGGGFFACIFQKEVCCFNIVVF